MTNPRRAPAAIATAAIFALAGGACGESGSGPGVGNASPGEPDGGGSEPAGVPGDTGDTGDAGDGGDGADGVDGRDTGDAADVPAGDTGDAAGDAAGDMGDAAPDAGDAGDAADAPEVELPPAVCEGEVPYCASACGSDWLLGNAACLDGEWHCPEGILMSDCPPETCWGLPEPGEVCDAGTWGCAPEPIDYEVCPALMCLSCHLWEGPVVESGCACDCDGGNVTCAPVDPEPECSATSTSNLDGVAIVMTGDDCTFTLAEAAAGIEIPYNVVVESEVDGVVPLPQDGGQCGSPGPSGLIVFERLAGAGGGDETTYCLCDVGLCPGPSEAPVTLVPGVFPAAFAWDGTSWFGPSDFDNPKGPPFPSGIYVLTVSAQGKADAPGGFTPFEAAATFTVHLVP